MGHLEGQGGVPGPNYGDLLRDPLAEAHDADLRGFEPSRERRHQWRDMLHSFPWAAELRPPQDICEPCSVPQAPLLHDRLCTSHVAWLAAVPRPYRARVDAADVRCKEHDVCR